MDRENINDDVIRSLVQAVEHREPAISNLQELKNARERDGHRRRFPLIGTIAASIILLIGIMFLNTPDKVSSREPAALPKANEISEIRTDFVIRDAKIKIIWIQKKDFKLK